MSTALEQLSDEFVALVAPKLVDVLVSAIGEKLKANDDPLLTVEQSSKRLGVGRDKVYELVRAGLLKKARGITDIRIRQSVLDAYGR